MATANDSDFSGDDIDDLPQEINVIDSKKHLAQEGDLITQQVKAQKEKIKEKRRHFQQLCTEQKKGKEKDGKVKRKSVKENTLQSHQEDAKGKQAKKVKFDKADDDSSLTRPKSTNDQESDIPPIEKLAEDKPSEDFIPFNCNESKVKPVWTKDFFKVNTALEASLAFKDKHLYGSHIHRQPMAKHLAMAEKRKARYPKTTKS